MNLAVLVINIVARLEVEGTAGGEATLSIDAGRAVSSRGVHP